MTKLYYYMTFTVGITILMKLAGLPFISDNIINYFGLDPNNLTVATSSFVLSLITLFSIGGAVSTFFFGKENTLLATVAGGLMSVGIGVFVSIIQYAKNYSDSVNGWVFYLIYLIFSVYIVGYLMSLLEWWSGRG